MAYDIGYTDAKHAVARSISHDERAVLAMREDVCPSDRADAAIEELEELGLEDYAQEGPGLIDAWGTHDGREWRVLLVDGIVHGIARYV